VIKALALIHLGNREWGNDLRPFDRLGAIGACQSMVVEGQSLVRSDAGREVISDDSRLRLWFNDIE
jgi:hypothetical protein